MRIEIYVKVNIVCYACFMTQKTVNEIMIGLPDGVFAVKIAMAKCLILEIVEID